MFPQHIEKIDTWVFDLDHTLYTHEESLFPQVDRLMLKYMVETLKIPQSQAAVLKEQYYEAYGLTMYGLMRDYAIDPQDFLAKTHQVDLSELQPKPELAQLIQGLPGRKLIFTNSVCSYAHRVLHALGLAHCFSDVFDIVQADYQPKPQALSYTHFFARCNVDPSCALFFDDMLVNVEAAEQAGMASVLLNCFNTPVSSTIVQTTSLPTYLDALHTRLSSEVYA